MQILIKRIVENVQKNKWLFASLIFFIVWKFFLVGVLWENRSIPPVIDDSLVYMLHIDGTLECQNFFSCEDTVINLNTYAGYDHLTYRFMVGALGKFFHWDALETYKYSFYFGTLLLAFAIYRFTVSLYPHQPKIGAYTLSLFTLFSGSGSYHGFYWVVPSFFAFIFFLLLASYIVSDKKIGPWWPLIILTILGFFSHVLFLYSLLIFLFYFVFISFFTKHFSLITLQKVICIIGIGTSLHLASDFYFRQLESYHPYGPLTLSSEIISIHSTETFPTITSALITDFNFKKTFPGWQSIEHNYFRWIFYSFWSYVTFCICLGILLYHRQFKLVSIYFSSLLLTLFSAVSAHGERSLLFLWPLTFLYFGLGLWFFWKTLRAHIDNFRVRQFFKLLVVLVFSFFTAITLLYSYLWNKYLNQYSNYSIPGEMFSYLEQLPEEETLYYSDKAYFLEQFFYFNKISSKPARVLDVREASLYMTVQENKVQSDRIKQLALFETFFETINILPGFEKKNRVFDPVYPELPVIEGVSFQKEKSFGDLVIYRVLSK